MYNGNKLLGKHRETGNPILQMGVQKDTTSVKGNLVISNKILDEIYCLDPKKPT